MPNNVKNSINIQTRHGIKSNECLHFTIMKGNIEDEAKFDINYESIVNGVDHSDYVSPEMITFPIQYANQLKIKEEKTEEEVLTESGLEERYHDYFNKSYVDSKLIKGEDALKDNQENVQIAYNEETNEYVIGVSNKQNFNCSVKNIEIESIIIKADEPVDFEHERNPESLALDNPILIVRPSLFTLNTQLDYNLRVRSSAKPQQDQTTTYKPTHSLQNSTKSNKDAIHNNTLSPKRHHNIVNTAKSRQGGKTVKSYRYAIHNNQVEHQIMDECVGEQNQEIALRTPKQIQTARKNIHKCSVCLSAYQTRSRLESHVSRCHTEHEPFVCCICGRDFPQKSHVAIHLNAAHCRFKEPYKCEMCYMTFCNSDMFGKHMRAHTIRSFKCSVCCKQFSRRWNYTSHMRRHSAQTYDKICV